MIAQRETVSIQVRGTFHRGMGGGGIAPIPRAQDTANTPFTPPVQSSVPRICSSFGGLDSLSAVLCPGRVT